MFILLKELCRWPLNIVSVWVWAKWRGQGDKQRIILTMRTFRSAFAGHQRQACDQGWRFRLRHHTRAEIYCVWSAMEEGTAKEVN